MSLRIRSFWLLALTVIGVVTLCALSAGAASATLPLNVVPTPGEVQRFFADLTHHVHTGPDAAAQGSPKATIATVFATADGKKSVTVSVAQYPTAAAAYAAFKAAAVRAGNGAHPVTMQRRIGQRSYSFVGTNAAFAAVGALDGALVVEGSLKGYRLDIATFDRLVGLTRMADEIAAATLI